MLPAGGSVCDCTVKKGSVKEKKKEKKKSVHALDRQKSKYVVLIKNEKTKKQRNKSGPLLLDERNPRLGGGVGGSEALP